MITKMEMTEPYIVGFKVYGKLDKEEMKIVFEDILRELELPEKFSIYMHLEDFSLSTFIEGVKFSFKHLKKFLIQIEKMALIVDSKLLRNFATIEYMFIPNIELKAFSTKENQVAIEWLRA